MIFTRCACPTPDRFDCIRIRYQLDRADLGEPEACECPCHDEFEDEDSDY